MSRWLLYTYNDAYTKQIKNPIYILVNYTNIITLSLRNRMRFSYVPYYISDFGTWMSQEARNTHGRV